MKKITYYVSATAFLFAVIAAFASTSSDMLAPYGMDPNTGSCIECELAPNQIGCGEGTGAICKCIIEEVEVDAYGSRIGNLCQSVLRRP